MSSQQQRVSDKIEIQINFLKKAKYFTTDTEERNIYNIIVKHDDRKTSFKFGDSIHNTENGLKPTRNDILETICSDYHNGKDNYPTFESFCEEFGYNVDSRTDEKIYKNCIALSQKLKMVIWDSEMIQKIQEELDEGGDKN